MYYSLGEQVGVHQLVSALGVVYLPTVAVGSHNACQVEMSVSYLLGFFNVEHQVSQDLENWTLPSTSSPWTQSVGAKGYHLLTQVTGLEAPYVRVVLKGGLFASASLMIGINLSEQ